MIEKALPHYLKILKKEKSPCFKTINLNEKINTAIKHLGKCELCEWRCRVNRYNKTGKCRASHEMEINSYFEHFGEESFLVPSFTIFFNACNLSCDFCQNWTISNRIEKGKRLTEEKLAGVIDEHSRCRNVNFVGGDPTPYLPHILRILKYVKADMPVVWNSNFYMSEKSMELLKGVVDVYLTDWKYGNDKCAKRLSKAEDYWEIVSRNHLLASEDSEMVIRHLVMPNHFDCCTRPILDFIADNFSDKVVVNVMDQYRPDYKADQHKDIDRKLRSEEFEQAVEYAESIGIILC